MIRLKARVGHLLLIHYLFVLFVDGMTQPLWVLASAVAVLIQERALYSLFWNFGIQCGHCFCTQRYTSTSSIIILILSCIHWTIDIWLMKWAKDCDNDDGRGRLGAILLSIIKYTGFLYCGSTWSSLFSLCNNVYFCLRISI